MAVEDEGNSNRRVSSHLLNTESSRSHSVLTLYLHSEAKDAEDGHLVKTFGKVRLRVVAHMFCVENVYSTVALLTSTRHRLGGYKNAVARGVLATEHVVFRCVHF